MNGFTPHVQLAIAEFRATHPDYVDAGPSWARKWTMHGRDGQSIAFWYYLNEFADRFGAPRETMVLDWAALEINGVRTEGPLEDVRAKGRAFLNANHEAFARAAC